jgi:hypothetical protein
MNIIKNLCLLVVLACASNSIVAHDDVVSLVEEQQEVVELATPWYKNSIIRRDLMAVGTTIVLYVAAVYTKKVQSPMSFLRVAQVRFEKFCTDYDEGLRVEHKCCICHESVTCIRYCDNCCLNNFICQACINNTVKSAAWIYDAAGKRIKNIQCPMCFCSLRHCYDQESYDFDQVSNDDGYGADAYLGNRNDMNAFNSWQEQGATKDSSEIAKDLHGGKSLAQIRAEMLARDKNK